MTAPHPRESDEAAEARWIADLRARGVKAAHPNDGWVHRDENKIHLCYPQFNDGVAVGDLMALGWPRWPEKTRIVRIVGTSNNSFAPPWENPWYLHFEDVVDNDV